MLYIKKQVHNLNYNEPFYIYFVFISSLSQIFLLYIFSHKLINIQNNIDIIYSINIHKILKFTIINFLLLNMILFRWHIAKSRKRLSKRTLTIAKSPTT